MDGRTDGGECISSRATAVSNYIYNAGFSIREQIRPQSTHTSQPGAVFDISRRMLLCRGATSIRRADLFYQQEVTTQQNAGATQSPPSEQNNNVKQTRLFRCRLFCRTND